MRPYRVPELANKYLNYDMIQKHTELPAFPDARVHLLYIFLQHSSVNAERAELYALVTSLVQVGLDTHESIDTTAGNHGELMMRSRQLKVLAGDYYSSRFYHLLAQYGDLKAIAILSKAVSEVNVLKIKLYGKMKSLLLSAEEYLSQMVQLNMQLFLSFTPLIEPSIQELWKTLLNEVTRCETIEREMARTASPEEGERGYAYWYLLGQVNEDEKKMLSMEKTDSRDWTKLMLKYKAMDDLLDKLRHSVSSVQSAISMGDEEGISAQMSGILIPFSQRINRYRTAVREG
ncbi:heptaprenyl diphosphate synthase component 1 [Paenibacillus dakarensis]|uniref:heptaprenyl diphosphate synthase component 1 n=1 Tax=Paenibacillus dakarensis TaxID=1527293 RepID=UPI0006D53B44|nr:heptaprenyl diphosphate synthase component 1 [Paenibacillus dakarensis]